MKVVYLATGAANMYCGSCMRDNTLVAAMKSLELDVLLVPLYTPMRVDEEDVSQERVFYSGIQAYVLQQFTRPSLGRDLLVRASGSQALLHLMPRFDLGSAVDPKKNAELTISMLRGEAGNQRPLLEELAGWLKTEVRPDLVHLTNTLISGAARTLKQTLNVPLVCGLHGEDIFVDGLPDPYRDQAMQLICQNAAEIDHFIAISEYYTNCFGERMCLDPARITLVRPGIALEDYSSYKPPAASPNRPLTIGYFARISPEKGLHLLAEAFIRLAQSGEFPGLRLEAGGYLSRAHAGYVASIQKTIQQAGLSEQVNILGTLDRQGKLDFFHRIDILSVPTIYRDPKGLPVLEALASGVPVVQPEHGAFPELVQATGGGLLHRPEDPADLAEKLALLLRDADLRQTLGQRGQAAVQANFSATRMASETIAVYQRLLQAH